MKDVAIIEVTKSNRKSFLLPFGNKRFKVKTVVDNVSYERFSNAGEYGIEDLIGAIERFSETEFLWVRYDQEI